MEDFFLRGLWDLRGGLRDLRGGHGDFWDGGGHVVVIS
jgi:hypothetical protein